MDSLSESQNCVLDFAPDERDLILVAPTARLGLGAEPETTSPLPPAAIVPHVTTPSLLARLEGLPAWKLVALTVGVGLLVGTGLVALLGSKAAAGAAAAAL